jgi:lipopolysaccharide export system permease protein
MTGGTLARYFGLKFLGTVLIVFAGIFMLVALLDYIELMRRASDVPNVSAILVAKTSIYRVPQITERIMPFCILIGAMSCYLNLSRRLELVVARAAGMSAWQFISPALVVAFLLGIVATTIYNPLSATLQERSKRFEAELFGQNQEGMLSGLGSSGGAFWLSQRSPDGTSAIINAQSTRGQGVYLNGLTVFTFDTAGRFDSRVEARAATLEPGVWVLQDARVFRIDQLPVSEPEYRLKTSLSPEQVRESFATPETVPFWELPLYINIADHAGLVAAGYRLQFQKLLAQPFLMTAMVFLAAAVSLRFFRLGGVQKMVLSGMAAGFLLYVMSKMTDDLSKAELLNPAAAAWLPVLVGGLTGFVALLYQEDG